MRRIDKVGICEPRDALRRTEVVCESPFLPAPFDVMLRGRTFVEIQRSYNAVSRVYRVTDERAPTVYLKICAGLGAERDRLLWLVGRLPVPRVELFVTHRGTDYLLLSELSGRPADAKVWRGNADKVVHLIARAVRAVHMVDLNGCPFDARVPVLLRFAKRVVEGGHVDQSQFSKAYRHLAPTEVYRRTLELRPPEARPVFTHGDCCLPNILITSDGQFGFVDVGMAGTSDPWRDLALMSRSIRRNLGEEWVAHFIAAYGADMDPLHMEFFAHLDQLVMARGRLPVTPIPGSEVCGPRGSSC